MGIAAADVGERLALPWTRPPRTPVGAWPRVVAAWMAMRGRRRAQGRQGGRGGSGARAAAADDAAGRRRPTGPRRTSVGKRLPWSWLRGRGTSLCTRGAGGGSSRGSTAMDEATGRPRRWSPPWTRPRGECCGRCRCGRGRGGHGGAGAAAADRPPTVRPQRMSSPGTRPRGRPLGDVAAPLRMWLCGGDGEQRAANVGEATGRLRSCLRRRGRADGGGGCRGGRGHGR